MRQAERQAAPSGTETTPRKVEGERSFCTQELKPSEGNPRKSALQSTHVINVKQFPKSPSAPSEMLLLPFQEDPHPWGAPETTWPPSVGLQTLPASLGSGAAIFPAPPPKLNNGDGDGDGWFSGGRDN